MIRRTGIFALRGLGDMNPQDVSLNFDPAAGSQPATAALQSWMQQAGASGLKTDGVWGQCSHSAFQKVTGLTPSPDAMSSVLNLGALGIPSSNVKVWKPGSNDVCYNGTDTFNVTTVDQQNALPDPGIMMANVFGIPVPASFCSAGRVPNMQTQQCSCPASAPLDPNTGYCVATPVPGPTIGPATTTTPPAVVGTPPVTVLTSTPTPVTGTPASSGINWSLLHINPVKLASMRSNMGALATSRGGALVTATATASSVMSTKEKVAIGAVAVLGLAAVAYFLMHKKPATPNCYYANCGQ